MSAIGAHAVVLGGGMSGLMAAHVLADHFERVTVVERDGHETAAPRRGVPQGWHPHALVLKAVDLLDELLPGMKESYVQDGGVPVGMMSQHRLFYFGHQLRQSEAGLDTVWASRPFLEKGIRERLRARSEVTLRQGCFAVRPLAPTRGRITGVVVEKPDGGGPESLAADLVVDATGRTGRTRTWLSDLGYPLPREERVKVNLAYASRILRCGPDVFANDRAIAVGPRLDRPRGLYFTVQEESRWTLTVYGYGDFRPSADTDEFMAQVRELAPDDVWAVIEAAEPQTEVRVFQVPETYRRRYDKLPRFPEGLLVTGDALAALNPLYGTGMMYSAAYALILDRRLREGIDGLPRRFFKDAGRAVAGSWRFSSLSDSFLPGVGGSGLPGAGLALWYLRRLVAAAEHDAALAADFIRVASALRSPVALARPGVLLRTLRPRTTRTRLP
ncbi:FAD-dependent oxidoreductase [Streptomyces uncialis]|uniref:FAD-dependent oxidoreductase n=1 Tax=Streptomyces uncialis TaxID=1048205 RepID=UPI0022574C19|nr:FAD-dependent monooxygenase [Streptomyces uncialis]MCX4661778.1 FAD-dependent oxidoreductase [Streptomyces uncialis]